MQGLQIIIQAFRKYKNEIFWWIGFCLVCQYYHFINRNDDEDIDDLDALYELDEIYIELSELRDDITKQLVELDLKKSSLKKSKTDPDTDQE